VKALMASGNNDDDDYAWTHDKFVARNCIKLLTPFSVTSFQYDCYFAN
jgi:hypothetical protein